MVQLCGVIISGIIAAIEQFRVIVAIRNPFRSRSAGTRTQWSELHDQRLAVRSR